MCHPRADAAPLYDQLCHRCSPAGIFKSFPEGIAPKTRFNVDRERERNSAGGCRELLRCVSCLRSLAFVGAVSGFAVSGRFRRGRSRHRFRTSVQQRFLPRGRFLKSRIGSMMRGLCCCDGKQTYASACRCRNKKVLCHFTTYSVVEAPIWCAIWSSVPWHLG